MKVLHVFDHSLPLHSGYTFRSRAILMQQRAMGWQTCHVTSSKHEEAIQSPSDKEDVEGLTFYRTPAISGLIAKLPVINQLAVIPALQKRIEQVAALEKPDVIQAHSPALNGIAAIRAGRKLGIPVVYEVRGFWEDAAVDHGTSTEGSLRYRLTRGLETWATKHAQAVTCICEGIRSDLIARGINKDKITIIGNAVNIENFQMIEHQDQALSEKLGLTNSFVIGFIGSFYHYEGLDLLIKALPAVIEKTPQAKLLLVGGGAQMDLVKSLVAGLNLSDNVVITGRIPHEEITSYYSLLNLIALPRKSIRLTELVTPLKPLEAMALGIPVLASDIGGHRELIKDTQNGYLFKADDVTALADKINTIATANNDVDIIKGGRHYVESERNWPTVVAGYQTVYQYAQTQLNSGSLRPAR